MKKARVMKAHIYLPLGKSKKKHAFVCVTIQQFQEIRKKFFSDCFHITKRVTNLIYSSMAFIFAKFQFNVMDADVGYECV